MRHGVLALVLLLAGCVGEAGPTRPASIPHDEPPSVAKGSPSATPEEATFRVGGAYSILLGPDPSPACPCGRAVVEESTPVFALDYDPAWAAPFTSWSFTAAWNATTPSSARLVVQLIDLDGGASAMRLAGPNPLAVDLPRAALRDGASYRLDVRTELPGVLVDERMDVLLELVK